MSESFIKKIDNGPHAASQGGLTDRELEHCARLGCGGDDVHWSFSDAGLRRTIEAARRIGQSSVPNFDEVWKKMEARGYRYGREPLSNVRFGWKLALDALGLKPLKDK